MLIIRHRVNEMSLLADIPVSDGIEVDVRSEGNRLILTHDAFSVGEDFEEFLRKYHHSTLVLNVKEEGISSQCDDYLSNFEISNYFYLDQSLPEMRHRGLAGNVASASRFSRYESIQTVSKLRNITSWVWVDTFEGFFPRQSDIETIKELGLRICIASPELYGLEHLESAKRLSETLSAYEVGMDAVCTKEPGIWR